MAFNDVRVAPTSFQAIEKTSHQGCTTAIDTIELIEIDGDRPASIQARFGV
jgi:hypothetical protein